MAVPPALALLLMFGPWRTASPKPLEADGPSSAPAKNEPTRPPSLATPDMTQTVSTVLGVCLLGTAVVLGLAKARARAPSQGSAIAVRQSVRLSSRHTVHAIEFDDRLLLLGECDGSLRVLHSGEERESAAVRPAPAFDAPDDEDDGVMLKDMVIPRPPRPGAAAHAAKTNNRGLADFRTLLGKTQVQA
ncbi:MAG: flagellar biosynthetic protein FliO [Planctomycetota bacterium]